MTTGLLDTEPAPSAVASITPRQAWRAARAPVAIAVVVLLVAVIAAVRQGSVGSGYLRHDAARPAGGRAIAQLLGDRDVDVTRRSTVERVHATTTFVPVAGRVPAAEVRKALFAAGQDVVVVGADTAYLRELGLDTNVTAALPSANREPRCEVGAAVTAGRARLGGYRYRGGACYDGTLYTEERDGSRVTILGDGDFLTNEYLDEQGNAALGLGLLGRYGRVDWVLPEDAEVAAPDEPQGFLDLVPRPFYWGFAQLLVAVLFAAAWRARRLGPVVAEPLPVVVRASETVEGRARLYEGGKARERAAEALRDGARHRLRTLLGLTLDADRQALCAAVGERAGRDAAAVGSLLYGPPPGDDAGLVRLASDLDSLQAEVRRS